MLASWLKLYSHGEVLALEAAATCLCSPFMEELKCSIVSRGWSDGPALALTM